MTGGRLWAVLTAVFGLATFVIFAAFAQLPETKAAAQCMTTGAVIQFELARTQGDLGAIFGGPDDACRPLVIAAMDAINTLDVWAFIPVYTAFGIAAALMLARGALNVWSIGAIGCALVALAADYVETINLLAITKTLDAAQALTPLSSTGAWVKFGALALHGVCCARLCFTAPRRLILGAALLLPAPAYGAMAYDSAQLAAVLSAATGIAWITLLIFALIDSVRGARRPA